jgi:hypothetical protein
MSDLVIFTAKGSVTDEDFQNSFQQVIADPRFRKGSKVLTYDLESAFEPTTKDPEESAKHINSFMSHFAPRVAVVVHKEESLGLGQLIRRHCEDFGIAFQVFNDPDAAKEWLDLDTP